MRPQAGISVYLLPLGRPQWADSGQLYGATGAGPTADSPTARHQPPRITLATACGCCSRQACASPRHWASTSRTWISARTTPVRHWQGRQAEDTAAQRSRPAARNMGIHKEEGAGTRLVVLGGEEGRLLPENRGDGHAASTSPRPRNGVGQDGVFLVTIRKRLEHRHIQTTIHHAEKSDQAAETRLRARKGQ
jgi:hypothetical protein